MRGRIRDKRVEEMSAYLEAKKTLRAKHTINTNLMLDFLTNQWAGCPYIIYIYYFILS